MKIRVDFVTNSSSSSFVIVGREVKISEIDLNDNNTYYCAGMELGDGQDIFEMDEELLSYLTSEIVASKISDFGNDPYASILNFYKSYLIYNYGSDWDSDDDTGLTVRQLSSKIPPDEKFNILHFEKDNHSTDGIEDLKRRYGG